MSVSHNIPVTPGGQLQEKGNSDNGWLVQLPLFWHGLGIQLFIACEQKAPVK